MVDDLGKKVKRNQERLDSEANPAFLPDDQVNGLSAVPLQGAVVATCMH